MRFSKRDNVRLSGIKRNRVLLGPRKVNIHVNNYCNHRCLFCWYHSPLLGLKQKREELDFDTLKGIIDDCAGMGVEIIDLEGEGEVFLYSRIIDVIAYIKSLTCGNGKARYYQALKTLLLWLYNNEYTQVKIIDKVPAPKVQKTHACYNE